MQNQDIQESNFRSEMKTNNLRITNVRLQIFTILSEATQPLSIKQIVDKVNNAHFVSVYRSIDALHEVGIVKQVPQGFKNLFELSESFIPHHHHAICSSCGSITNIKSSHLEKLIREISENIQFKEASHQIELHGMCANCS